MGVAGRREEGWAWGVEYQLQGSKELECLVRKGGGGLEQEWGWGEGGSEFGFEEGTVSGGEAGPAVRGVPLPAVL